MITLLRIKALEKLYINTKKSHQNYKFTLIKEKIRLSCKSGFNLIQNTTCFLIIYFSEILRFRPNSSPPIGFGPNHIRVVVSRDRAYGH